MKEDNIDKEIVHIDDFKMFNVEQEWSVFLAKTKEETTTSSPVITSTPSGGHVRKLPLRILSIAAGLAALIGCFFFMNRETAYNSQEEIAKAPVKQNVIQKEITPDDKEQTVKEDAIVDLVPQTDFRKYDINEEIILSDGSTLTMLAKSSIKFPKSFDGLSERYVELESGNVEFDVVSNQNQPFRVLTENSGIYITGTTFTLKKSGIETVVKTISGSVEMYSREDESIKTVINAGEEFIFNGKDIVEVSLVKELPIEENIIDQKPVLETPVKKEDVVMSSYNLANIKDLASEHFENNLKFKRKAIEKSLLNETIKIPQSAINTGDISTVDVILKALDEQFELEYSTIDECESCYEISSIKIKE